MFDWISTCQESTLQKLELLEAPRILFIII